MSPAVEALVRLQAQGIDDDEDGFDRVRRSCGLSNDSGGVGRGRGRYNAS